MTIAVTAVSGQLGSEITRALITLNTGEPIIGLARNPDKVNGLDINVRPGDYAATTQLTTSLKNVDTLLLVSGNTAPEERIVQHRNVIEAARSAGVKKIVYTSVQGSDKGTSFSHIIQSNRQTETDVQQSGMAWSIGRNGIYIEPDVEYIDSYRNAGEIANSAGNGRCAYVTRPELAVAYAALLTSDKHNGYTYKLHGERLTQTQLVDYMNMAFGSNLRYRTMSQEEFKADRIAELGEKMGTIIAGIYEGIHNGALDSPGDFETAVGRPHQSWDDYFKSLRS